MTTMIADNTAETTTGIETFSIDSAHSQLGFTVRHLGFSKVRGYFNAFEGTIEFDPDNLNSLTTGAAIETDTVSTGDDKRDNHLRSADFFDAEKFPTITFESTGIRIVGDDRFKLTGEFSLHGVTRSIELDARYLGESPDPWGGTRVGFEAHGTINRKDFGLNWNVALEAGGLLVGDDVDLVLEVQAVRN